MHDFRYLLYYPLGLLPSVFFTLRFLIQWLKSEKKKESYVDPLFWKLSFTGNFLLFIHYFIQVQYPFAILQVGNALIAWRNLNLMQSKSPYTYSSVLKIFMIVIGSVISLCVLQNIWVLESQEWIRIPSLKENHPSLLWAGIGCFGQGLFASRFWLQWWQAESDHKSTLSSSFWWVSVSGSILSFTYFMHTGDLVSLLHHSFGMVPYFRNLMLIYQKPPVLT